MELGFFKTEKIDAAFSITLVGSRDLLSLPARNSDTNTTYRVGEAQRRNISVVWHG